MRKTVFANVLLGTICLCMVGYLAWYIRAIPSVETAEVDYCGEQSVATDLVYRKEDADSVMVARLSSYDASWQTSSAAGLTNYIQRMNESEATRLLMEQQKQQALDAFIEQRVKQAEEETTLLAQMQEEARRAIAESGGINATLEDVIHLAPNVQVTSGGVTVGATTGGAGKTSGVTVVTAEESGGDGTAIGGKEATDDYYGQVTATYRCTCHECYNDSKIPEVEEGGIGVLVDGIIIPGGINIQFDGGPPGTFMTQVSTKVSGRSVIILYNRHEVSGSSGTIYPKVTSDGSVG